MFQTFDGVATSDVSWSEVFTNRRVLLCSATRISSVFLLEYLQNLKAYAELYKLMGIDQVYLISSTNRFALALLHNVCPELTALYDVDLAFVNRLGDTRKDANTVDRFKLANFWNYQVLVNNGAIEQLYAQPFTVAEILKYNDTRFSMSHMGPEFCKDSNLYTPMFLKCVPTITKSLFYSRLHPNLELKRYLLDNPK